MFKGKAIGFDHYGEVDVFEERDLIFELTDKKPILIKVERAALNPVDISIRKGLLANGKPLNRFRVLGNEVQGEVIALDPSVTGFSIGDKVIALVPSGGNAEYLAAAAKNVFKIPNEMLLEVAACYPMVAETAYWALNPYFYELKSGDTLAIIGASGSVGSLVLQFARSKEITIIAVAGKNNSEYVKKLGADMVIDYRDPIAVNEYADQADFVINASLFNSGEDVGVTLVKDGGTLLGLNGVPKKVCNKNVSLKKLDRTKEMTYQKAIPFVLEFYRQHDVEFKIGRSMPLTLEGIKEAHHLFEDKNTSGKIVLENPTIH